MEIALPLPIASCLSEVEGQQGLALGLYVSGRLGLGRAAEVAGMNRLAFQQMIARERVPMDYSLRDLRDDVESLNLGEP